MYLESKMIRFFLFALLTLSNPAEIRPTINTTYTFKVADRNGCNRTKTLTQNVSVCTQLHSTASISEILINVFPNPTSDSFTIHSNSDIELSIINSLRQKVKTISLNGFNNQKIQITNLAAGIYILEDSKNHKTLNQKIIVTD